MSNQTEIDLSSLARELRLEPRQVEQTVALLDEGNTVPFITRYRKERTGQLDEEQIRAIQKAVHERRQIAERADAILRLIAAQDKLTDELKQSILAADSLKRLEDLYLPYRPKRQSRATKAREQGLEPLANTIWDGKTPQADLDAAAKSFVDPEQGVDDGEAALRGAADIIAERIGENADFRQYSREIGKRTGTFKVNVAKSHKDDAKNSEYRDYFDYSEAVAKIPPHRLLAVNRGEKEGILKNRFEWDIEKAERKIADALSLSRHPACEFLRECVRDALDRFIGPALDRECRREATEAAEKHAVEVFAKNLRNLLLQPPLRGKKLLAIDPGFRTGCKLAVLDTHGSLVASDLIYVTGSEDKRTENEQKLADFIKEHECGLIAIGNGTACRETEELVSSVIENHFPELRYLIANEAGASIYSTSAIARQEFPDLDATVRGTISLGRRVIDPLSELVKIDPQHLGVGMYQHDVTPRLLQDSLEEVIESCVNYVGADLNTASVSLLQRVSGLNQLIARRICDFRQDHGQIKQRQQLLEVAGIGEATFTQAAGFLKIRDSEEPLDATWIHPESYDDARKLLAALDVEPQEILTKGRFTQALEGKSLEELATQLGFTRAKLDELIADLSRPDQDPRGEHAEPTFKKGILKLEDLHAGMELTGTVLNVVDFGVFVDIGLKDSGLVHISQMSTGFVKSPHEVVGVGDSITVWVLDIDRERKRVGLTMIEPGTEAPKKEPPPERTARQKKTSQQQKSNHKKPKKRKRKKKKEPPLPKVEEGQTLRGFDELKALWKQSGK
ncbi:MAG: RNA-binding transcriptional accessory protein [Planctomycetaceae bacterium]|nr:RNA-binding transcriptional accessory protein [Planctomycetaceae bacterium]